LLRVDGFSNRGCMYTLLGKNCRGQYMLVFDTVNNSFVCIPFSSLCYNTPICSCKIP
jgi:hypothetical protein